MLLEWNKFINVINASGIKDIIDILLVSFVFYELIKIVRDTRAVQLMKGIVALLLLYFIAVQAEFKTMSFLMENVLGTGIIALIIVFQPELRRMLEHMAQTKISNFSMFQSSDIEIKKRNNLIQKSIEAVCQSCEYLSKNKIGALIVFEKKTKLGEIARTGTRIDSQPSKELVGNIFFPNSPLHDGAMIIRDGRLYCAGCFLPLSQNYDISKEMGTRHRAALGMSENSDAIIVVVSEETGTISIASGGVITRNFTPQMLENRLKNELLTITDTKQSSKLHFWKVKK